MRRSDQIALDAKETADALKVLCAACHTKLDEPCLDAEGRPRKPHKVRIKQGRWAAQSVRLQARHGKCEAQRAVFNAKLLEITLRENKSEVTGVIVGMHEDIYVKMTVHADGSFTVVEEGKIK